MNTIITLLLNIFGPAIASIEGRLQGVFGVVISNLATSEQQTLHDAQAAYTKARASGSDVGTAATAALNTFYREEISDISSAGRAAFDFFLKGIEPTS